MDAIENTMRKWLGRIFIGVLAIFVIWFAYIRFTASGTGDKAPEIEAQLFNGEQFKLSDLRGGYVLIDFWGTWCGPCRAESPELVAFYERNKDKVTIVSIALEKDKSNWARVREIDGLVWKHHIVQENSFVMGSSIARDYGVSSIPNKFLLDPEGVIISTGSFEEMQALIR